MFCINMSSVIIRYVIQTRLPPNRWYNIKQHYVNVKCRNSLRIFSLVVYVYLILLTVNYKVYEHLGNNNRCQG